MVKYTFTFYYLLLNRSTHGWQCMERLGGIHLSKVFSGVCDINEDMEETNYKFEYRICSFNTF